MSENDMAAEPDTSSVVAEMDTTPDTSATSQDPSLAGEGDTNQPSAQEQIDDPLDEGIVPPHRDPLRGLNLTPAEQLEGDTLTERLEREEPEVWDAEAQVSPERQPDRAGRLEALPDDDDPSDTVGEAQSSWAADVGVAGGAASAEEAAMHVVDEDEAPGLTGVEDEGGTPG